MTNEINYPTLKNTIYQEKLTKLIDDVGGFFAFGNEQFEEAMKEHNYKKEDLCSTGLGMIMPKANLKNYIEQSKELNEWFDKEVKKLNPNSVIIYELNNHECYYTGDISDALDILKGYGFTREQVLAVFHNKKAIIN